MSYRSRRIIRSRRMFTSSNIAENRDIVMSLPKKFSEDKDERQEKSLETRSTEKEETMPKDEIKNLLCDLVKKVDFSESLPKDERKNVSCDLVKKIDFSQSLPKVERKNLSCDIVKKIYPSDFRNWPILSLLKSEFIPQIRMVMVYGKNGNRALIVTKDKNVYTLDYDKNDSKGSNGYIGLRPQKIEELSGKNIKTFACNSYFVLTLTEEGEVYFWEFNKKHNLHTPAVVSQVTDLSDKHIVDIACGSSHSLALTNDGKVYAWGENNYGQLGNENSSIFDGSLPRQVKHELEGQKIVHIACGSTFNMVVTDTGKLYAWGNNESCQILYHIDNITSTFTPTSTSTFTPTSTSPFTPTSTSPFTSTSTSPFTTTSTYPYNVFSSFSNSKSQSTSLSPKNVGKIEPPQNCKKYYVYPCKITSLLSEKVIVKVSCGFKHTLVLTDEGKVYAWGSNAEGQVGINKNIIAPTLVDMPELVEDIAAYGNLSVAISNNKIVYVWGDCFGQHIKVPFLTEFSRIHDAFAYSESRVMYKPLIVSTNDYDYFEEVLNIIESLKTRFDDPATSDCIIEVEGQCIHVHKAILQIRCSERFKKLQHDWFEKEDIPIKTYVSDKFSYIVYKAFLKYLYTGTVDLPSEDALDLIKLADDYGETNLKKECSRIIQQAIEVSNVALYFGKAIEYNAKDLEEFCFEFALRHMKDVIATNNYEKLDICTKYELMFRAVKKYASQM